MKLLVTSPPPKAEPQLASPMATEPEIRRALPVHPRRIPTPNQTRPNSQPAGHSQSRSRSLPVRLTYLRVKVDGARRRRSTTGSNPRIRRSAFAAIV